MHDLSSFFSKRAFICTALQDIAVFNVLQMLVVAKLQINAADSARTPSAAPKTQKIIQSMTVPAEARKLRILCLHGYLQNAEVGNVI
jgi:hypothetical protein